MILVTLRGKRSLIRRRVSLDCRYDGGSGTATTAGATDAAPGGLRGRVPGPRALSEASQVPMVHGGDVVPATFGAGRLGDLSFRSAGGIVSSSSTAGLGCEMPGGRSPGLLDRAVLSRRRGSTTRFRGSGIQYSTKKPSPPILLLEKIAKDGRDLAGLPARQEERIAYAVLTVAISKRRFLLKGGAVRATPSCSWTMGRLALARGSAGAPAGASS